MKKIYIKPAIKNTVLLCNDSLLTASASKGIYNDDIASGSEAFSNKEGAYDIWNNDDSNIW